MWGRLRDFLVINNLIAMKVNKMETIEIVKYRGFNINIYPDDMDFDPREEYDNVGHMVCFHSRYNLGDKHEFNSPDDFREFAEAENFPVLFSLYLYDHSGITMSVDPFSCPWDSGQVGWIYCTQEQVEHEWDGDVEKAKTYLIGEVKEYDHCLTGEIYGFNVEPVEANKNIECDDSCWGFIGWEYAREEMVSQAKSAIDYAIEEYRESAVSAVKSERKRRLEIDNFMSSCWAY